jgi:DNA-binding transcriptional LysR family regulator
LTDDGAVFLERARHILEAIEAAESELSQRSTKPRGKLRVGLPLVGDPFLATLGRFKQAYPEVNLDVEFSDRPVDVVEEGFDVVVRSGEVRDSRLTGRTLGDFVMMLAASPRYLVACGALRSPDDLSMHSCIRFRFPSTGKLQQWPVGNDMKENPPEIPQSLICNNLEARVSFALAGLGIAYLPDFAIKDKLKTGELVRVLPQCEEAGHFRILWPSGRQPSPKLRAFVDFMTAQLFPG